MRGMSSISGLAANQSIILEAERVLGLVVPEMGRRLVLP